MKSKTALKIICVICAICGHFFFANGKNQNFVKAKK